MARYSVYGVARYSRIHEEASLCQWTGSVTLVSGLRLHANCRIGTVCCVTNLYRVLCMNLSLVNWFKLTVTSILWASRRNRLLCSHTSLPEAHKKWMKLGGKHFFCKKILCIHGWNRKKNRNKAEMKPQWWWRRDTRRLPYICSMHLMVTISIAHLLLGSHLQQSSIQNPTFRIHNNCKW